MSILKSLLSLAVLPLLIVNIAKADGLSDLDNAVSSGANTPKNERSLFVVDEKTNTVSVYKVKAMDAQISSGAVDELSAAEKDAVMKKAIEAVQIPANLVTSFKVESNEVGSALEDLKESTTPAWFGRWYRRAWNRGYYGGCGYGGGYGYGYGYGRGYYGGNCGYYGGGCGYYGGGCGYYGGGYGYGYGGCGYYWAW